MEGADPLLLTGVVFGALGAEAQARAFYDELTRDPDTNDAPAFTVEDGAYVSARWPGDAYLFAKKFLTRLAAVS